MDGFQKRFYEMIKQYPNCMNDRKILKAVMTDFFPEKKREVNIILTSFDSNLLMKLQQGDDITLNALRGIKALVDEFGLGDAHAKWAVQTWCYGLNYSDIADALQIVAAEQTAEGNPEQKKPNMIAQEYKFTDGMYKVGRDIPPGEYAVNIITPTGRYVCGAHCSIYREANQRGYVGAVDVSPTAYITFEDGYYFQIYGYGATVLAKPV